jgi:hypothetical protein
VEIFYKLLESIYYQGKGKLAHRNQDLVQGARFLYEGDWVSKMHDQALIFQKYWMVDNSSYFKEWKAASLDRRVARGFAAQYYQQGWRCNRSYLWRQNVRVGKQDFFEQHNSVPSDERIFFWQQMEYLTMWSSSHQHRAHQDFIAHIKPGFNLKKLRDNFQKTLSAYQAPPWMQHRLSPRRLGAQNAEKETTEFHNATFAFIRDIALHLAADPTTVRDYNSKHEPIGSDSFKPLIELIVFSTEHLQVDKKEKNKTRELYGQHGNWHGRTESWRKNIQTRLGFTKKTCNKTFVKQTLLMVFHSVFKAGHDKASRKARRKAEKNELSLARFLKQMKFYLHA